MDFKEKILKLPIPRKTFMEILEVHDKEVPMANLLAYFFNPNNKHGLGNLFIRSLLKTEYYELDIKNNTTSIATLISQSTNKLEKQKEILDNISNVTVKTEVPTKTEVDTSISENDNQKRIDILIDTKDFVICIEFKINHDLDNPLNIYQKYIETKYQKTEKKLFYIILTPYKKEPTDNIKNNKLFKQIIIRHFIDNVIAEIPFNYQKENDKNIYAHYFYDFLQTLDNRSIDFKINKIIKNSDYAIASAPYIVMSNDVSDFWSKKLTTIKVKILAKENRGFCYHQNSNGGFIVINRNDFVLKIRIEKDKWKIEKWTLKNKKEKVLFTFNYNTEFRIITNQINNI